MYGNFIRNIDFLGFSPNLHVNGCEKFKSNFTLILSIIVIIMSLLCTGYFGSELITKLYPIVVTTRERPDTIEKINLSEKELLIILGIEDDKTIYYIDPSIYVAFGIRSTIKINKNGNTTIQDYEEEVIDVGICSKYFKNHDIIENNIKIPLDTVYCVKPNSSYIKGFYGSEDEFTTFRFIFKKCVNGTSDIICKTPQEIDSKIQGGYVSIQYSLFNYDQKNYINPIQKYIYDDYYLINSASTFFYNVILDPFKFLTDEGLIFENLREDRGWSKSNKVSSISIRDDKIFDIMFQVNPETLIYLRNYAKLQTILSQIGGFIKSFMLISRYISIVFSRSLWYINFIDYAQDGVLKNIIEYQDKNKINNSQIINSNLTILPINSNSIRLTRINMRTKIKNAKRICWENYSLTILYIFKEYVPFRICHSKKHKLLFIQNLDRLYRKITSIEILFKVFWKIEMIESSLTNKLKKISYEEIFISTLRDNIEMNSNLFKYSK